MRTYNEAKQKKPYKTTPGRFSVARPKIDVNGLKSSSAPYRLLLLVGDKSGRYKEGNLVYSMALINHQKRKKLIPSGGFR